MLRQVEDVAAHHPVGRVRSIRVRIGELSGVEPELLASAYDELVSDTPLRDAVLELQRVPLQGVCRHCGSRFRIERFNFRCGRCGSVDLTLSGGEEMLLESVIMEATEP
jgi:hydrogenase nickel incorporation protein HypA/HybF